MNAMFDEAAWTRAEADRIGAMIRDVERFDRGFGKTELGNRKMLRLVDRHRAAARFFGEPDDPGFCLFSSTPTIGEFSSNNPDHLLAPIVLPAWDQCLAFVIRGTWTVEKLLGSGELLEKAGTMNPEVKSRLKRTRCSWHEGPIRPDRDGGTRCSLLTVTRGQYVGVWWVCAHCRESLERRHPGSLSWCVPAREPS
ncbi:hypothetical protein CJ178_28455 [Rhodococcus sp. ACPA4]|uniref:hypothetical protein n=1 Tax=Rhodococcus sp. ACPA4 TaxID=2028571 RepID=UPI000BB136D8|nr:hypothetical protein [Rhodococcus sp. ACPA4]PBC37950.1 hypothetical protein CJ178_28455 [Rhodococcus sp. ACPA4]